MGSFENWRKRRKGRLAWKRGLKGEKKVARTTRGTRIGGPGQYDVVKGRGKYEVKNRKTPVTLPELKKMKARGVTTIYSKSGYTAPALAWGKRNGMRLRRL